MCVFHHPSEGQNSVQSISFEPTILEVECSQVLEQSAELIIKVDYEPPFAYSVDDPTNLVIPMGDLINITFFYNDTDPSDGYVGGIPDAASICRLWGPTVIVPLPISVSENGNGSYSVIIDSLDPNLYATTNGEPVLSDEPYYLLAYFHSHNVSACDATIRIEIIKTPTDVVCFNNPQTTLLPGYTFVLELQYMDTWHDLPISDASVSVNISDSNILKLTTNLNESETNPGLYTLSFLAGYPGHVEVTITMEKDFYQRYVWSYLVVVEPDPYWEPPPPHPLLVYAVSAIPLLYVLRGYTSRVGWSRREKLQGFLSVIIAVLLDAYFYLFVTQLNIIVHNTIAIPFTTIPMMPITAIISWTYCFWLAIGKGVDNNISR